MSYSSKKTLASIGTGILLLIAYVIYASGSSTPDPEDLKSWAVVMLVFIGISIAAVIIIQILFHIAFAIGIAVKEKEHDDKTVERMIKSSVLEDERDKLISLKSSYSGYVVAGFGFVASLVALATGTSYMIVLNIMVGSFFMGSIIEGCVSVCLNERGVQNG